MVIFTWRILLPTFRLLAQDLHFRTEDFYTSATDYGSLPSDLGLRPIPSMMDLLGELAFSSGVDQEMRVRNRGGKMKGWVVLEVEDKRKMCGTMMLMC